MVSISYSVNGLFMMRSVTGVERFAREVLRELGQMVEPGFLEVVVPRDFEGDASFLGEIPLVRYGRLSGIPWEQIDFARYLRRSGRLGFNLCNTLPLLAPSGATVVHDICYKVHPEFYRGARNRLSRAWHCLNYWVAFKRSTRIMTVSEFSKSEMRRVYGVSPEKVAVVGCGWQHMERVEADYSVVQRLGLEGREFAFTMSSLAPNKNVGWVLSCAEANPEMLFVIAGSSSLSEVFRDAPGNVMFPGRVSDGEAKALMSTCAVFLFPTLYEGFGLPPLEALSCGAKVLVSDTPVMHEVYGGAVSYIRKLESAISQAQATDAGSVSRVLQAKTWHVTSEKLYSSCL